MSKRIQLSRAKGWRMPSNTAKVDRTTKCGNPYTSETVPGHATSAADAFAQGGGPIGRRRADGVRSAG